MRAGLRKNQENQVRAIDRLGGAAGAKVVAALRLFPVHEPLDSASARIPVDISVRKGLHNSDHGRHGKHTPSAASLAAPDKGMPGLRPPKMHPMTPKQKRAMDSER